MEKLRREIVEDLRSDMDVIFHMNTSRVPGMPPVCRMMNIQMYRQSVWEISFQFAKWHAKRNDEVIEKFYSAMCQLDTPKRGELRRILTQLLP